MQVNRRNLILTSAATLLGGTSLAARAQAFPAKAVKIIVPYPAGGATDVIARMVAEKLALKWEQPVIVDNRAGAGSTVGAEAAAKSAPDGYTLFETTSAHTISASLYSKLSYDPIRDFTAITLTAIVPLVLVTSPRVPAKNLNALVGWIKGQANGVSVASTGNGTAQHLTAELFKKRTGVNTVHVPYRGDSPMITDLLGGQVDMAFATLSAVLPHIKSGKLNAIALAHTRRMSAIPDIPTFTEAGMPDFVAATWFGFFAPTGLAGELREKIYKDISAIVATPAMTQKLVEMGGEVSNSSPAQFDEFIGKEVAKWAEAVRTSGARVD